MKLLIDRKEVINELKNGQIINRAFSKAASVYKTRFTREVLEIAVPLIRTNLRNAQNLPERDGMKEFYDTQTRMAKRAAGIRVGKGDHRHFIDCFEVGYETGKGGHGRIQISNSKTVYSRHGEFNLFKLLWNGTKTYVVPMELTQEQRLRLSRIGGRSLLNEYKRRRKEHLDRVQAEYMRSRKRQLIETHEEKGRARKIEQDKTMRREFENLLAGGTGRPGKEVRAHDINLYGIAPREQALEGAGKFVQLGTMKTRPGKSVSMVYQPEKEFVEFAKEREPKPMHFYNRFKGRFYCNYVRRGIEGNVVNSLHAFVAECIADGLIAARAEIDESKIYDAIGQEKYV